MTIIDHRANELAREHHEAIRKDDHEAVERLQAARADHLRTLLLPLEQGLDSLRAPARTPTKKSYAQVYREVMETRRRAFAVVELARELQKDMRDWKEANK